MLIRTWAFVSKFNKLVSRNQYTRFFYKNNFIRTSLKFGQKLRTTSEQSRLGFGFINANFTFLSKILLFSSNSTVSNVEILQMLRSIEFLLRFTRFFFYNNKLYKNTQAEICPKIKNKLRTITRLKF